MTDKIAQFHKQQYANLETLRKTGEGVKTPIWFYQEGMTLYIRTGGNSYKVKRIRRNPSVRIAPSTMRGDLRGDWVDGKAEVVNGPELERIHKLYAKKYGLLKKLFDIFGGLSSPDTVTVAVHLEE